MDLFCTLISFLQDNAPPSLVLVYQKLLCMLHLLLGLLCQELDHMPQGHIITVKVIRLRKV